jgi:hypothetical protein
LYFYKIIGDAQGNQKQAKMAEGAIPHAKVKKINVK